jgi:hypothetical protein
MCAPAPRFSPSSSAAWVGSRGRTFWSSIDGATPSPSGSLVSLEISFDSYLTSWSLIRRRRPQLWRRKRGRYQSFFWPLPIRSARGWWRELGTPGRERYRIFRFESSLGAKWLQILSEIAPDIRRAHIIFNPVTAPYYNLYLRVIEEHAAESTMEPVPVQVHDEAELARAITRAGEQPGVGLVVLPDSSNIVHRELIIRLAAWYRLPAISIISGISLPTAA